ncbi:serine hydrolase domain-containing protein [Streptomyces sp. IBSBF 3136]|uniref:serine hydrolase domain-containing protein n=1 Tax=Streptomyces sp. IBSBF 3136 TaxID=2903524 RepID=UPI002FDBE54B
MSHQELAEAVASRAKEFEIPGAAVGVLVDGVEITACHGVTNVEQPQPVDDRTLFHLASLSKTFTATAVMRLAQEGRLELGATVRSYVPELRLADELATAEITVLNLLNHTSGLDWNLIDLRPEDVSLAAFVARMAELPLIAKPGARASYSQAGYNLLGRVVEKVTGQPFEQAMRELVLEPAGLTNTFYGLDDVIIRRFAVGHNRSEDGELRLAHPWKSWPAGVLGNDPGGGAISAVSDLLRWARFQLGSGEGVLPTEVLDQMKEPTVDLRGSSLGHAFGLGWFLKDVGGVRTVGHGGSGNCQYSDLLIVPERNFAVVALANAGPVGYPFTQAVLQWALERYLGVVEQDPEPSPYDVARAREVVGRYTNGAMNLDVADTGDGLTLAVEIKPEIRSGSADDMPPDLPPAAMGFLSRDGDDYIVTEGGLKGQRGYFSREDSGTVTGVDLAGRLFTRLSDAI